MKASSSCNPEKTPPELRSEIVHLLFRILDYGAYLNLVLPSIHESRAYTPQQRFFLHRTLHSIVVWKKKYEWMIAGFSHIPLRKIEKKILYYLFVGIDGLLNGGENAEHAAVHETVEAVKREKGKKAAGFVNGILRTVQREAETVTWPSEANDPIAAVAVEWSHPEWLVDRWIARYGLGNTKSLCEWNNAWSNRTGIRVNRLKADAESFIGYCREQGYIEENSGHFGNFFTVTGISGLLRSDWFRKGYFHVQALSSGLAVEALAAKPDSRAVDVCASPGGKTTQIAENMQDTGTVVAVDRYRNRIKLVSDTVKRAGLRSVLPVVGDAADIVIRNADYVLIDAPCSGFGTLRMKPDIRWKRTVNDIEDLSAVQRRILANAASFLRPGGYAVYSTCTIEPEENGDVISDFLSENALFEQVNTDLPADIAGGGVEKDLTTLPFLHNMDGSYIAKLRKIS